MDKYQIFWLICGLLLLLAEVLVPGFILFFFGVAALIIMALLFVIPPFSEVFWLQLLLWMCLSIVLVFFLRNKFGNVFQGRVFTSEMEDYVGHEAEVLADITETEAGRVKYRGTSWKALSLKGEIKTGEKVMLKDKLENESMTFLVEKL